MMTVMSASHISKSTSGTKSAIQPRGLIELEAARTARLFGPTTEITQWFVLHTKSRQEKALARALDAAGYACYLPLIETVRFHGHRKKTVSMPLFSNYLFVHGTREATWFATSTKRVANVIPVQDQERFERDLDQIRRALAGGAELHPYRYLEIGKRVRVTSGPFRDIEGMIENRQGCDRLILQINTLGQAASLEIDASLLELVD